MKTFFKKIFLLAILIFSLTATAQTDSLEKILPGLKEDSTKVNIIIDLANQYKRKTDYNRAIQKAEEGILLSRTSK